MSARRERERGGITKAQAHTVTRVLRVYAVVDPVTFEPVRCDVLASARTGKPKVVFASRRAAELAAGELSFLLGQDHRACRCYHRDHWHLTTTPGRSRG